MSYTLNDRHMYTEWDRCTLFYRPASSHFHTDLNFHCDTMCCDKWCPFLSSKHSKNQMHCHYISLKIQDSYFGSIFRNIKYFQTFWIFSMLCLNNVYVNTVQFELKNKKHFDGKKMFLSPIFSFENISSSSVLLVLITMRGNVYIKAGVIETL